MNIVYSHFEISQSKQKTSCVSRRFFVAVTSRECQQMTAGRLKELYTEGVYWQEIIDKISDQTRQMMAQWLCRGFRTACSTLAKKEDSQQDMGTVDAHSIY